MQGKKQYQEKLFNSFQLSDRVPEYNFYRRLKDVLHLDFLYQKTKDFYGSSGQKSIDPVVFFKLCLVGYLENITSDRKLIEHCSMRLDILYFLGYDIDEELPWHSTISRTRGLFPGSVFEAVFTRVFEMCVSAGMVSGHTQAIDSAPVKANASMDSLELKVPEADLDRHLREICHISKGDQDRPLRQANKCMQLSAIAYNLKKYLKFVEKHSKSGAASLPALLSRVLAVVRLILSPYDRLRFSF
ncbi:transposase [Jejuia sp. DST062]|uniref:transposase n=1 Tax=Flavisericum labens TaxID=3377112 RepID=UPI00387B10E3